MRSGSSSIHMDPSTDSLKIESEKNCVYQFVSSSGLPSAHARAVRHYLLSHDSFKSSDLRKIADSAQPRMKESREGLGPK